MENINQTAQIDQINQLDQTNEINDLNEDISVKQEPKIEITKIININGNTFVLKSNGRLYGSGNCYVISTINPERVYLKSDTETELDLCVIDIGSDIKDCLYVIDSRHMSYDMFVKNCSIANLCNTTYKISETTTQGTLQYLHQIILFFIELLVKFYRALIEWIKKIIQH